MAFRMSQMKYGKGVCNIEFVDIEVLDYLPHAYQAGTKDKLDLGVLEEYGLAINFAKILKGHEEFVLSVPQGDMVNVFCGRIPELRTVQAKIIIERSTVKFLAGGFNSFLSLTEGYPVAAAHVRESVGQGVTLLRIYFCEKVIPAP